MIFAKFWWNWPRGYKEVRVIKKGIQADRQKNDQKSLNSLEHCEEVSLNEYKLKYIFNGSHASKQFNWLPSLSHRLPVYVARQVQMNDFPLLLQVPPFRQGFDWQGNLSMNYISHIYWIISYGTSKQTWWKMLFLKQKYTRLKQLQKMISHSKTMRVI